MGGPNARRWVGVGFLVYVFACFVSDACSSALPGRGWDFGAPLVLRWRVEVLYCAVHVRTA